MIWLVHTGADISGPEEWRLGKFAVYLKGVRNVIGKAMQKIRVSLSDCSDMRVKLSNCRNTYIKSNGPNRTSALRRENDQWLYDSPVPPCQTISIGIHCKTPPMLSINKDEST